jgi:hypothetical protein
MGSISLGWALVAGRKRVPSPATGKTALLIFVTLFIDSLNVYRLGVAHLPGAANLYYLAKSQRFL